MAWKLGGALVAVMLLNGCMGFNGSLGKIRNSPGLSAAEPLFGFSEDRCLDDPRNLALLAAGIASTAKTDVNDNSNNTQKTFRFPGCNTEVQSLAKAIVAMEGKSSNDTPPF